jgi:hypothetical protein
MYRASSIRRVGKTKRPHPGLFQVGTARQSALFEPRAI